MGKRPGEHVHESNREQATFWEQARPLWATMQERFGEQAGPFGLAAIEAAEPQVGAGVS